MTTTQGRLLVTCVGGFACTEWELHNRLNTERVFGSDQHFELRIKFMNLVMEQLQNMWWKMVRWLHFFSYRLSSHILTHYVVSVGLATAPVQRFSAVAEARSWEQKRNVFDVSCPPDEAIMASSYRPQAPCLSA